MSAHRSPPGLTGPLREALKYLATHEEVELLTAELQEYLSQANPNSHLEVAPELSLDSHTLNLDWSEGVDEFMGKTMDELWEILGVIDKAIPLFNRLQDPESAHDPWTDEGGKWLQDHGEPLTLRWHQLVGVVKMLHNAFDNKPTLLMDEVGLGKTIQVTAFFAVLSYYREHFAAHGSYPGSFGQSPFSSIFLLAAGSDRSSSLETANKRWRDQHPAVPDLPAVFVVPVTLVPQLVSELHRYLRRGTFDVLPYTGTHQTRSTWWTDVWSARSNQPEGRKIIVTTSKVTSSE
jgi:SNF2 family DNA or RNA helicase